MTDPKSQSTASLSASPSCIDAGRPTIEHLIRLNYQNVYGFALRMCGRPDEAEDLTQQTFLIAHRALDQLCDPTRAKAWLLAIVRSCFLKSLRRRRPSAASVLELDVNMVADSAIQDDHVDREALSQAVASLTDDYRVVVLMYFFEELSYKEISARLDIPMGTVMSRLSRAKERLRQCLATSNSGQ